MTTDIRLQAIHGYAHKARKRSRDEFISDFESPVLVIDPYTEAHEDSFRTQQQKGTGRGLTTSVANVRKRPGSNAFASMVTVGRAPNNDIQIKADTVSKFHAYIKLDSEAGPGIVDANSTFGTSVGEKKLAANVETAPLTSGTEVFFGSLRTTYYEPGPFYDMLMAFFAP